jgi:hypothetical protein
MIDITEIETVSDLDYKVRVMAILDLSRASQYEP